MKKHIRYFINFLLIFSLSVNECIACNQTSISNYYEVSYVSKQEELNYKYQNTYSKRIKNLNKKISFIIISFFNLQKKQHKKVANLLYTQTEIFQKIRVRLAQLTFIKIKYSKSNITSSLYIA
ncbi:conserved protein of unknown function [Tenacibaculum jejuense]|uniref:Lipoprotein n=1 Tax=Tenacibaculum jejuense TaxID=584609 RepID=A0A238U8F5_9FLAO|nr:conserved protein of unknown function [Tenacibaculum jejuense]